MAAHFLWPFGRIVSVSRRSSFIALVCLAAFASVGMPALAQMQLPGAMAPAGEGLVARPAGPAGPAKPKRAAPPPPPKVPSDDGLLNHSLVQNGRAGTFQFVRDGKNLRLSRVTLAGEKISRSSETCTVDTPGMPLAVTQAGKPDGVTRYAAALAGCAIEFDVLDRAILVAPVAKVCEFVDADCRVDPAGLWGQPASEIGAARAKEIERARGPAEQSMRNQFRAWVDEAGKSKDRDMVQRISRFQAEFSSRRSEICDRYAREAEHGYCALVLTQARTAALGGHIPLPESPPTEPGPGRRKR